MGTTTEALGRRYIPDLLRHVAFRRFWTAQTVSYVGDQVTTVALPLVAVLVLNASALWMGILAAVTWLPNLLFSLHAGSFIDRRGRRRQLMIATDVARGLLLATVPLAFALHVLTLVQLFIVAAATGTLAVFFNLCANSMFAVLVDRKDFVTGASLTRGSYSFSWIAGPSLGGVLVQTLSAPITLIVDTVSFFISALLMRSINPTEPAPRPSNEPAAVLGGLTFMRRTPVLLAKVSAGTLLNLFYAIYSALLFLFAARELHLSAGLIGLALGGGAIGALVGSALTAKINKRIGLGPALIVGSIVYPAALVLVPIASGPPVLAFVLLIVAEFGSGFGLMLCDITGNSIQQAITPDKYRSRVQGAHQMLNYGIRPVGALLGGVLGTWIGLRPSLWVAVAGGVASAAFLLPSPLPRMRELPDEAA